MACLRLTSEHTGELKSGAFHMFCPRLCVGALVVARDIQMQKSQSCSLLSHGLLNSHPLHWSGR